MRPSRARPVGSAMVAAVAAVLAAFPAHGTSELPCTRANAPACTAAAHQLESGQAGASDRVQALALFQ